MPANQRKTTKDSVFDHHVRCILKSGLLLDEDMDSLLTYYNPDNENCNEKGLTTFQKLLGVFSFTTTLLTVQRKCPILYISISSSPFIYFSIRHLRKIIHKRTKKHNLEILVETVHNITKLNRMIYEYFKLRNLIDPNIVCIINPYTKGMKQLIEIILNEEVNLLYAFRIFIRQFGTYVPLLKTDYAYLENLELGDLNTSNVSCINDCVTCLQKLCDICVLMISNVLTCLALTMCSSLWTKYEINLDEILEKIVPKMKSLAIDCYNKVNKKFDDVKFHYLNRTQVKNQFKKPKPNASNKLQMSTYNTMVHTTDILEKSQKIFKKLQQYDMQSLSEKEILGKCILDLRGHVFDYYESLDILYKLYQVNINATQNKSVVNSFPMKKEELNERKINIIDASLNPSEPSEDEEYELYIGANETSSDTNSFSYYEEQESRKFASLLCQELKKKLKSHAQFVAARKKRGIIDEEPETKEKLCDVVEPPDFNEHLNDRIVVHPPPPPPMPLNLGFYDGDDKELYTVDDFLESIRAASKHRDHIEEVFGSNNED